MCTHYKNMEPKKKSCFLLVTHIKDLINTTNYYKKEKVSKEYVHYLIINIFHNNTRL